MCAFSSPTSHPSLFRLLSPRALRGAPAAVLLPAFHHTLTSRSPSRPSVCRHTSPSVLIPALRTVGNIVTGDDVQTQARAGGTLA